MSRILYIVMVTITIHFFIECYYSKSIYLTAFPSVEKPALFFCLFQSSEIDLMLGIMIISL